MPVIQLLATLTLISDVAMGFFVFYILFKRVGTVKLLDPFLKFCQKNALLLAFIVALVATSGSLFFSEIMKFTPCKLCWFQRIFMYPQALILGIATYFKDRHVRKYIIPMCAVGGSFSVYNYYIQLFPPETLACSLNSLESCSQKIVMLYGYITFPVMALTASVLILTLMLLKKSD